MKTAPLPIKRLLGTTLLSLLPLTAGAQPGNAVPSDEQQAFAGLSALEKGLAIAREADRRDLGFGDTQAKMTMVLTNAHGESATRALRIRTLEQQNDGDKSLIIFDSPKDVKGTAFLSFTHKQGSDDQWLYLPSLKRVKRIAQSNQSGPFVGSEFSYEDLSSQEVEKYEYRYLRDETFDKREHYVVAFDPINPKSGYSEQHVWIDKAHFRPWKVAFYDRKGDHLKTLTVESYQQYLNNYWRPDKQLMVNHLTGKRTELVFEDYRFNNDFADRDFNKSALKRAR